jgi:hypothetical protein
VEALAFVVATRPISQFGREVSFGTARNVSAASLTGKKRTDYIVHDHLQQVEDALSLLRYRPFKRVSLWSDFGRARCATKSPMST